MRDLIVARTAILQRDIVLGRLLDSSGTVSKETIFFNCGAVRPTQSRRAPGHAGITIPQTRILSGVLADDFHPCTGSICAVCIGAPACSKPQYKAFATVNLSFVECAGETTHTTGQARAEATRRTLVRMRPSCHMCSLCSTFWEQPPPANAKMILCYTLSFTALLFLRWRFYRQFSHRHM